MTEELTELLPWRLAALGGLLVGGISASFGIELWTALARAGLSFAAFGALGLLGRALLGPRPEPKPGQPKDKPEPR